MLNALIKGAGPTGLACAVALVQQGIAVTVVEKRQRRPQGAGRQNVVAIRPEALRNLEALGALKYLITHGALTDMTEGKTYNHWDGSVFDWVPLFQRYPAASPDIDSDARNESYTTPGKITDQIPSSFVLLGDLEDALLDVCEKLGVEVLHETTFRMEPAQSISGDAEHDSERSTTFAARLQTLRCSAGQTNDHFVQDTTSVPDLIICASGKNDTELYTDLNFHRHVGIKLDEQSLPELDWTSDFNSADASSVVSSTDASTNFRSLHLGEEGEIESQQYSVFAVRHSIARRSSESQHKPECTNGTITHMIRKDGTGSPPQPLTEITMSHQDVSHFIVHLPRDLDLTSETRQPLESYVIERVNAKLDTAFTSVQDMNDQNALVVGDPLMPVLVETTTAPQYVYGSNVILVGDAAMSCSPASGLGADIGMTNDSRTVGLLGKELKHSMQYRDLVERSKNWSAALDRFHRRKAESAVLWAQASRMFYITTKEANDILMQIEANRIDSGSGSAMVAVTF